MGQRWEFAANGPDGWAEEDTAWITPQALAARLRWTMAAPRRLQRELPDPRDFAEAPPWAPMPAMSVSVLPPAPRKPRTEGIGLILSSPAFQRR